MYRIMIWGLITLIVGVNCKCTSISIVDDERALAYACIQSDLDDLNDIPTETEWIEFSVSRIKNIPDDAFSRFKDLRRLAFYNCHMHSISDNAFRGLDRLEWLIAHSTQLQVARTGWFRHLPNLKRLILDRCNLIHIEPEIFHLLPKVEKLSIRDNDLDCLPIDGLLFLRSLKTIEIDGNPWICQCRDTLQRFFLERRIVQENGKCLDRPCTEKTNLQCMTQVQIPVVASTIFVEDNIRKEGTNVQISGLSSLNLLPDKTSWISISNVQLQIIPAYTFFRFGNSLRSLEIRDCLLPTIGTLSFAGLHKLERLILIGNRFSVLGNNWFRDLIGIQQLVLGRNGIERITPGSFSNIANTLRHLDLRNNRLNCFDTEELAYLRKLERLNTIGNPWTCRCQENLERFLFQRRIGFDSVNTCDKIENLPLQHIDEWRRLHEVEITNTTIGRLNWGSFEESITNITIPKPPSIEIITEKPTPMHHGSCTIDIHNNPNEFYTCKGIVSLDLLQSIPMTAHTIRLVRSYVRVLPPRSFSRYGTYLTRLEFHDCGIKIVNDSAFHGLDNLENLILRNNDLKTLEPDAFEGLTNLRHLDLSRNNLNRISNGVFDALPNLVSLDVSDNDMNCIGTEHMARALSHLRAFTVHNNPWTCLCGIKLAEFLQSRRITYDRNVLVSQSDRCYATHRPINTYNTVTKVVNDYIGSIEPGLGIFTSTRKPVNEKIEGTCTSNEEIDGLRYRCVGGNIHLFQTISYNVSVIEFHDGHLPFISADTLFKFCNLKELYIRNSGFKYIEKGAFDQLKQLRVLIIRDNPLEILPTNLFALRNLESLDLRGNSLKDIEPRAFENLPKLRYLNLQGNDLKCIFTSDLNELDMLESFEFSGNPLKWRCRVELEQFLETRRIKYMTVDDSCEGRELVKNLIANRVEGEDCATDSGIAIGIGAYFVGFIVPFVLWFS